MDFKLTGVPGPWYIIYIKKMSITARKAPAALFLLLFIFTLGKCLFAADPCPLHGRPLEHQEKPTASSHGLFCLCLPTIDLSPADGGFAAVLPAFRLTLDLSTGLVLRSLVLDIFHPPRFLVQA